MSDSIFPTDAADAEATYKHLVDRGRQLRAPHECQWYHTSAYCRGARNFILNFRQGTVKSDYTDAQGRTKFVYEELLAKYTMQKGRLLGMDLSPRVLPRNQSLDGQREAATVQAVLGHLFPASRVEALKGQILQPFLFYGNVGLSLWEDAEDPQAQDIHLIPPWQILPVPTGPTHPGAVRGLIVRKRMALEEIKRKVRNMKFRRGALADAEKMTERRGDVSESGNEGSLLIGASSVETWFTMYENTGRTAKPGAAAGKSDEVEVAWLGLVYLWDERDYMTERLAFVGSKLLARDSYWQTRTYKQVTTLHDIDVGGFWARSWMELQIPINSEQEGMAAATFANVKNLDNYGLTAVPTAMGLKNAVIMTPHKGGPKFIGYEWDSLTPANQSIQQIRPFTSGQFATAALNIGTALSDRMARQPPILSGETKRLDSTGAVGMVLESGNTNIAPSAVAIARAVAEMYRAATCRALTTFNIGDTIAVTMLDNSLLGIAYDAGRGAVRIADSGVPHPDKVEITVRSMAPVSKQQQKMELENQLKLGVIDLMDYRVQTRLLNLETPVGNGIEWENYVKARVENALLYYDGQNIPEGGEEQTGVLFSREADMHEVHLRVHREVVASIKFSLASLAVRRRILNHIRLHMEDGLGRIPDGMPPLEDAAEESLMMQQQQGQMTGPGM